MKIAEEAGMKGIYRVLSFHRDLQEWEIELARQYVRGDKMAGRDLPIIHEYEVTNLVPAAGRGVFARLLCADVTYTGAINYGAFGSGSTAFSSTSTQLNAEVYRKLCAGAAYDGPTAYIDWFIASGDVANQTFTEFGAFIDGTASANTGQAISLLLTGGWVKSGALFISLNISIAG